MKLHTKLYISILTVAALLLPTGCESILEEKVKSQFAESNLLSTKSGLESVLADAYAKNCNGGRTRNIVKREDMTSDILGQSGGGEEGTATPLINFRWDSSNEMEAICWMPFWRIIRNANIVMENIPAAKGFFSDKERSELYAETRFMRVWAYYQLWEQFGPIPIRRSSDDAPELPRATDEEFLVFMEEELLETIADLPEPGQEPAYGRVHKGGARGLLCLWYLNTKQWQKCADIAAELIADSRFGLFSDYSAMFALENEENNEFILVKTCLANSGTGNILLATALPWDFKKGIDACLEGVVNEKWSNYASQYRLYDEFYYSFDEKDQRKSRIMTKYEDSSGKVVDLLTDYTNATRGIKFPPDPDASGDVHGNDFPMIRYAEILLSRAEALNELKGPNQESIDLINLVRRRAGLDDLSLSGFTTKEELLEHILKERRWEFWYEGKRRRDLIRTGKYIEYARQRGITNADSYHVRFPIPQSAIDANKLLEQNNGY